MMYLGVIALFLATLTFVPEQIDGLFMLTTVGLFGSIWLFKRTRRDS